MLLGGIPREATLLAHLQRSFPNVRDVHLSGGGIYRYHLHVQIAKRQEGEAKNIIMGAFGGHYDIKQVIVVDEDVDIHNSTEMEWAVATRFQADRDLLVVTNSQGSKLDPSTRDGVGAKMGIDATKPLDAQKMKFKRIRVQGEENVDLQKVVGNMSCAWRSDQNLFRSRQSGATACLRAYREAASPHFAPVKCSRKCARIMTTRKLASKLFARRSHGLLEENWHAIYGRRSKRNNRQGYRAQGSLRLRGRPTVWCLPSPPSSLAGFPFIVESRKNPAFGGLFSIDYLEFSVSAETG